MTTYLVIRDGEIKMRLHDATLVDGKVSAPTKRGAGYLIDRELAKADGVFDAVAKLAKQCRYDQIDDKYIARLGISESGLVVIEELDYRQQQAAKQAETIRPREFGWTRQSDPVLIVDVRDQFGPYISHAGIKWSCRRRGDSFSRGPHSVCYAYLSMVEIKDQAAAYTFATNEKNREELRHIEQFNRMMEDGDNDGVNPPRGVAQLLDKIIGQIDKATSDKVDLRRRVERQAAMSPETTMGNCRRQAGKRALVLLDQGAKYEAVTHELDSYQDDAAYNDAIWD